MCPSPLSKQGLLGRASTQQSRSQSASSIPKQAVLLRRPCDRCRLQLTMDLTTRTLSPISWCLKCRGRGSTLQAILTRCLCSARENVLVQWSVWTLAWWLAWHSKCKVAALQALLGQVASDQTGKGHAKSCFGMGVARAVVPYCAHGELLRCSQVLGCHVRGRFFLSTPSAVCLLQFTPKLPNQFDLEERA